MTYSPAKVPLTSRGRPASATDPSTWTSYENVRDMPRQGFVLNGDGIVCIDLDYCLDDAGLTPLAEAVLGRCPGAYVEISPSGTGLHVWGRAQMDAGRKFAKLGGSVEVYPSGRYMTVTGRRYKVSGSTLSDVSSVVGWLLS